MHCLITAGSGGNGGEYENGQEGYPLQKKRRLSVGKAKLLEKHFEMDSKLEPHRKRQLSQVLDIDPRQVAVWFQNRRARSKTKTLQTEYDALKLRYLDLKSDYQDLLRENQNLMSELEILKKKVGDIGQDLCDEEIEEGAFCGRFPNPSVPPHQQFLRLEDSFLQSGEHAGFPNVEDQQASVGISWWGGWP